MTPVMWPVRRGMLTVGLVAAAVWPVWSQEPAPARSALEARLVELRQTAKLPAVTGVVFTSGHVLEQAAAGGRKIGADAAVTIADRWHIGSITKSFTATLVGKFVERGELKWTQTLGELLGKERAREYAPVTIENLLTHRSGLPANVAPAMMGTLLASGGGQCLYRKMR